MRCHIVKTRSHGGRSHQITIDIVRTSARRSRGRRMTLIGRRRVVLPTAHGPSHCTPHPPTAHRPTPLDQVGRCVPVLSCPSALPERILHVTCHGCRARSVNLRIRYHPSQSHLKREFFTSYTPCCISPAASAPQTKLPANF